MRRIFTKLPDERPAQCRTGDRRESNRATRGVAWLFSWPLFSGGRVNAAATYGGIVGSVWGSGVVSSGLMFLACYPCQQTHQSQKGRPQTPEVQSSAGLAFRASSFQSALAAKSATGTRTLNGGRDYPQHRLQGSARFSFVTVGPMTSRHRQCAQEPNLKARNLPQDCSQLPPEFPS